MKCKVILCVALLIASTCVADSKDLRGSNVSSEQPGQLLAESLSDNPYGHTWGEDWETDHGYCQEQDGSEPNQGITLGSVEVIVVLSKAPLATVYVVPR